MTAIAGWTERQQLSAFADLESRNSDAAARGFAALAAYQDVLELPQASPARVGLRDLAIMALSLGAMALMFYFPALQVLLIAVAAIFIGIGGSRRRKRSADRFAPCHHGLVAERSAR